MGISTIWVRVLRREGHWEGLLLCPLGQLQQVMLGKETWRYAGSRLSTDAGTTHHYCTLEGIYSTCSE